MSLVFYCPVWGVQFICISSRSEYCCAVIGTRLVHDEPCTNVLNGNKFAYFQSACDPQTDSLAACHLPAYVANGSHGLKKGKAWKGSHSTSKHAITWIAIERRVNCGGRREWPTCTGIQWQQWKQWGCGTLPANTIFLQGAGAGRHGWILADAVSGFACKRLFVCTVQISGNKNNYNDGSLCHFHLHSEIKQLRAQACSLQVKIRSGPTICFPCFYLLSFSCCWNMQLLSLN